MHNDYIAETIMRVRRHNYSDQFVCLSVCLSVTSVMIYY